MRPPSATKGAPPRITPLDADTLAALSDDDLAAYEEALETEYWERGRERLAAYCEMIEVPGTPVADATGEFFPRLLRPAAHHRLIMDAVQKMADGEWREVDGLMAFLPPGAAKSTYLSKIAASWLLGRKKGTNVIGLSYGQDLANRNARHVRAICRSENFRRIMGTTISEDNQAVDQWSLETGSDYKAAGLTAGVTGFRADWAAIDDPIKGREEADSDLIREKVWVTLQDDVATRLKPGGKLLLLMTRWHEDDPAGRILGQSWKGQSGLWRGTDGRLWYIINLPLIAEHADDPLGRRPGELLWPEWFRQEDADRLREQAKKGGSAARTWSSLYQQRPSPNEGAILATHYWKPWTKAELPEVESVYLSYDTAFEDGEENDYSAMTAWGVFKHTTKKPTGEEYPDHRHAILLGAWQDKVSAVSLMDIVREHAKLFRPDLILVEKKASGIQLIQELKRQRLPVKAWLPRGKPGTKGKIPRAHAIAFILEQGTVWYVPGKRTQVVLDQCAAFPYGTHDDSVDTVTQALAFFRDRWIFQVPDDEMDKDEREEFLNDRLAQRGQESRRLYDGSTRSNQAILGPRVEDVDLSLADRLEPRRRKLYS